MPEAPQESHAGSQSDVDSSNQAPTDRTVASADAAAAHNTDDPIEWRRIGLGTELIDYDDAWKLQRDIHATVAAGTAPPTVLLLEHAEVFTAGRRTQDSDRPLDGSRVIDVDRGGRITWHGPGQLVCYPIVPLPHPLDVVAHVRRMESAIIATCADFDISTDRIEGRSGVWCSADEHRPARKIAAIGVRVSRGVTMHGLALNVNCDLTWGQRIVPCGIADAGITSIAAECQERDVPDLLAVAACLEGHLDDVIRPTLSAVTSTPSIPA